MTATIDRFAAMPDEELLAVLDHGEDGPTVGFCPHCDGALHGPTDHCWCAGCDACANARLAVAEFNAATAEWVRRHPPAPTPPAPPAPADEEPF